MLQQLQQTFRSIIKSLEVIYIMEGAKPCARILVFEDELAKVSDFLSSNSLNYAVSDFKVAKQNLQSDFYSDKSIKISKNSVQKGYSLVYISKDTGIAENAKFMEDQNNHLELGLLLGYPRCCCEFFQENFNENRTDLTLKALECSQGYEFPFYTNISARHFDISLLSHFPHDFECRPSILIARNNLEIIQKHSKELAIMISGILQGPVVYASNEGIFLLRKYGKDGDEISYDGALTTTKNKMYYLLSSNKKLRIVSKNNFIINDINICGENYGIMLFI